MVCNNFIIFSAYIHHNSNIDIPLHQRERTLAKWRKRNSTSSSSAGLRRTRRQTHTPPHLKSARLSTHQKRAREARSYKEFAVASREEATGGAISTIRRSTRGPSTLTSCLKKKENCSKMKSKNIREMESMHSKFSSS